MGQINELSIVLLLLVVIDIHLQHLLQQREEITINHLTLIRKAFQQQLQERLQLFLITDQVEVGHALREPAIVERLAFEALNCDSRGEGVGGDRGEGVKARDLVGDLL